MSYAYDEAHVFDATTILFSLIGFDIFFLVGLTVWVNGLKRRYENAIWKIKRLESEKRDLAVAFNLEKADLVDPLNTNAMNNNRGRRIAPVQTPRRQRYRHLWEEEEANRGPRARTTCSSKA